ncbi:MAG: hypothetical protein R2867_21760 [Caldilineaceae bacterium]
MPYLNAIDNVMLPMTLAGVTGKGKRKRAEELLDLRGAAGTDETLLAGAFGW